MDELATQSAAQKGDLEAFGVLVEQHQASIRGFVAARIDDPFEAQDLAQEVFLVAYRRIGEIDVGRPLRPWLFAIAANLVRNHRRKRKVVPMGANSEEILALLNEQVESLDADWNEGPAFAALENCLGKLQGAARELLRLRYEEGLGIAEIGKSVGGKHSTITMKLHRLREQLRGCIEGRIAEEQHG